jgi:hypothetical protein
LASVIGEACLHDIRAIVPIRLTLSVDYLPIGGSPYVLCLELEPSGAGAVSGFANPM